MPLVRNQKSGTSGVCDQKKREKRKHLSSILKITRNFRSKNDFFSHIAGNEIPQIG